MQIAFITSEFVTEKECGGLGIYLDNISAILSEHGHKVTIITLSGCEGELSYKNNIDVIRVKRTRVEPLKDDINASLNMLENSWKLFKALKRANRNGIFNIVQSANYQAVGFFREHKLPTIVRVSSDSSLLRNAAEASFDYQRALKQKKIGDIIELMCVKHADAAYAPSSFCARTVTRRCGKKIDVIESPFVKKDMELDDVIYRTQLEGKEYLLFNSALSSLKGTHLGIEVTDYILSTYPKLNLVYVGSDGGIRQSNGSCQNIEGILRRQCDKYNGRVVYLGKIDHTKLYPIIQNSLACILPSRVDNLPNACIEAMSCGKIVIGTYGASFEQLIKNKYNGLLIQRDSAHALIKAIKYLLELSVQEREQMGLRAEEVSMRLQPEKIYSQVIAYYQQAINNFETRGRLLK
ncbi:MAG: glycosyltransferase family 4 protein [Lachnospiraceae bacterium]|nr:glycosyltransferase family 4 protein [Lachnospiraceae bacterium]